MFIEAVTTCVGYDDFLDVTLYENLPHFDRIVVVTSHEDKKTQSVCRKYSVPCVPTDAFTAKYSTFNKGRAINVGLGHLAGKEWILHLDADIVLPRTFRQLLDKTALEKDCLYGADRVNCYSWEQWMAFKNSNFSPFSYRWFINPPPNMPLGTRISHDAWGWGPLGYFQMWNIAAHKQYPLTCGTAEHSDVLFYGLWPHSKRRLIPEVITVHLESEQTAMGANWKGRTTKLFGPSEKSKLFGKPGKIGKPGDPCSIHHHHHCHCPPCPEPCPPYGPYGGWQNE